VRHGVVTDGAAHPLLLEVDAATVFDGDGVHPMSADTRADVHFSNVSVGEPVLLWKTVRRARRRQPLDRLSPAAEQ